MSDGWKGISFKSPELLLFESKQDGLNAINCLRTFYKMIKSRNKEKQEIF